LARPIQWANNHQSPEQSPVPRTITSPQNNHQSPTITAKATLAS
jgi:hypothetical protein